MRPRTTAAALLAVVPALVLAACATPAPTARATSRVGGVLAPTPDVAWREAARIDRLVPVLLDLDVGLREQPVDVVFQGSTEGELVYGGFDVRTRRIALGAERTHPDATLAHELVHALEPASWDVLPALIREGLADELAARAVPEVESELLAARAVSLAAYCDDADAQDPLSALMVPHGRIVMLEREHLAAYYGLGLLIVRRAGLDRITARAEAARAAGAEIVPAHELLAAAELPVDRTRWAPFVEELERSRAPRATAERMRD